MGITFHDIDGTEYGPKEYNADKFSIELARTNGEFIPYDLKRRVQDYELGINPFDRQHEKSQNEREEHLVLDIIECIGGTFIIWILSLIVCSIISYCIDVRFVSWIFSELLHYIPPIIYAIHSIRHFNDRKKR